MNTRIIDGKQIAQRVKQELSEEIRELGRGGVQPKLVVLLVGEDPASASYVRSKERLANELGMASAIVRLPDDVSEASLLVEIERLNADELVDGILVQLPLPPHIDSFTVLKTIRPDKDVDGFHPYNIGLYATGRSLVWPCTPSGIIHLLRASDIPIRGQRAVVVGRSQIVGWPMAQLLLAADATVTQCHRHTVDLADITKQADILISAVGQAGLITRDHVKDGATVIDVGMNRVDGKLVGDVLFDEVAQVAGAITPVPGGVGPMTVVMLMVNTVHLCKLRRP